MIDLQTGQKFNAFIIVPDNHPAAYDNPQRCTHTDMARVLAVDNAGNEREFVRSVWRFKIIGKGEKAKNDN